MVAVSVGSDDLGTVSISQKLELSSADFDANFSVWKLVSSQEWSVLGILSLVFDSLAGFQLMFLASDEESWSLVAIGLNADDFVITVILSDNDHEFLLLLVSLANEDGQFLAFVLFDIFR